MPPKNNVFTRSSGIGGQKGQKKSYFIFIIYFFIFKPKEYILPLLPPIFKKVSKYKALQANRGFLFLPPLLPPQLPPAAPFLHLREWERLLFIFIHLDKIAFQFNPHKIHDPFDLHFLKPLFPQV